MRNGIYREIDTVEIRDIKTGDMPGDKIRIGDNHILRSRIIFPVLLPELKKSGEKRLVFSVYGGSGVGKSEIASLLGYFCQCEGFPAYVLSGDNYVHRIPSENDEMRLSIFNSKGIKGLEEYLGSDEEIDFSLINNIIKSFKDGFHSIKLKRMGRSQNEISFDEVDFSDIQVLIIEWTHGNSSMLEGVDFPVFLYSTPEQTLEHRMKRARDKGADSPFVKQVLQIEQNMILSQADKSCFIIDVNGNVLSAEECRNGNS